MDESGSDRPVSEADAAAVIFPENRGWFDELSEEKKREVIDNERRRNQEISAHIAEEAAEPCCWCGNRDCSNKHNCVHG